MSVSRNPAGCVGRGPTCALRIVDVAAVREEGVERLGLALVGAGHLLAVGARQPVAERVVVVLAVALGEGVRLTLAQQDEGLPEVDRAADVLQELEPAAHGLRRPGLGAPGPDDSHLAEVECGLPAAIVLELAGELAVRRQADGLRERLRRLRPHHELVDGVGAEEVARGHAGHQVADGVRWISRYSSGGTPARWVASTSRLIVLTSPPPPLREHPSRCAGRECIRATKEGLNRTNAAHREAVGQRRRHSSVAARGVRRRTRRRQYDRVGLECAGRDSNPHRSGFGRTSGWHTGLSAGVSSDTPCPSGPLRSSYLRSAGVQQQGPGGLHRPVSFCASCSSIMRSTNPHSSGSQPEASASWATCAQNHGSPEREIPNSHCAAYHSRIGPSDSASSASGSGS